jgi:hypothetical protein
MRRQRQRGLFRECCLESLTTRIRWLLSSRGLVEREEEEEEEEEIDGSQGDERGGGNSGRQTKEQIHTGIIASKEKRKLNCQATYTVVSRVAGYVKCA